MKRGIEVEGIYFGNKMIFCQAADVQERPDEIRKYAVEHKIQCLYISDNDNILDYQHVGDLFPEYTVTMDVTKVKGLRPDNVNIMLRIEAYDDVAQLDGRDQVKFERDRHVVVLPLTRAIITQPHMFEGDVDL